MNKCPVCLFPSKFLSKDGKGIYEVICYKCGDFRITDEAADYLSKIFETERQTNHLSSWIRENQNVLLFERDIPKLKNLRTPTVEEKAEKLLLNFIKYYPDPGSVIPDIVSQLERVLVQKESANLVEATKISEERIEFILTSFTVSWCQNKYEFEYVLYDYLLGFKNVFAGRLPNRLKPEGWDFIHSIQKRNQESQIAFIAMKFEVELKSFSEEFVEAGILDAGYQPLRIDKHQHNNLIDDEIIANIRRSRFIVADFTFNNNGVYYEAGFARGLNIPVISICDKTHFESEKEKVHFDTNHYSFILYERDKGKDLRNNLKLRIEATIGRGNFNKDIT